MVFDFSSDCVRGVRTLSRPKLGDFLATEDVASLELAAYFKASFTGRLELRVEGQHIAVQLSVLEAKSLNVTPITLVAMPTQKDSLGTSSSFMVTKNTVYRVSVIAVSLRFPWLAATMPRSLAILARNPDQTEYTLFEQVFFSNKVCGDGVCDAGENASCSGDCGTPVCGDGVCSLYENADGCFVDCWTSLLDTCIPQARAMRAQGVTELNTTDTLGVLVRLVFTLQSIFGGYAHGFDGVSGEEKASPFLQLHYCSEDNTRRLTDTATGNVYLLPREVDANTIGSCTFDSEVTEFSTASEVSSKISEEFGLKASLDATFPSGSANGFMSLDAARSTFFGQIGQSCRCKNSVSLL
eukprot:TRINITY_DN331_c0_g1_i2.p2 TRINITY_DN331_c0_g1~~TRINITY_DN331_c0_g1_i2.p2  ORF type:complete len:354 (-),score=33.81 TRINITY_DN331_c0_g1_i2:1627-2688(-)